jgi:hypothetical protein
MTDLTRSVRERKHPRNPGQLDLVEQYPNPALDPNCTVLNHFNDYLGSTSFIDEKGHIFTGLGNAKIDTLQYKFGWSSLLLPGTGDFLTTPDSADWRLDNGSNANQWTVEFWIRFPVDPSGTVVGFLQQRQSNDNFWAISLTTGNNLQFLIRSAGANIVNINNLWNPADSLWYHVAVVKQGSTGYKMFINGTQIGSTVIDTNPIPSFSGPLTIGRYVNATGGISYMGGNMDEFRISKGIARYTTTYVPQTTQFDIY